MRKFLKPVMILAISLSLTGGVAFAMTPKPQTEKAPVAKVSTVAPKEETKPAEKVEAAPAETPATPTAQEAPAPAVAPVSDSEDVIWNHFISNGFTREQTAGIMGNLQQEHNFQTDGDGLAQWTDGRKARLQQIPGSDTLMVQLNYIIYELSTSYQNARTAIKASTTVEGATIAFQNQYEGCGNCMQGQRIQYAYDILGRH